MAQPFQRTDFERLIPADKKLPPEWMASLFERGQPTVYRGSDLGFIGMPIGGITTGQLYLGGDGRLWLWDIFNQTKLIEQPGCIHYTNPLYASWNGGLDQGFALQLEGAAGSRPLSSEGFNEVSFRGQYPIGTVDYRDPACPLTATLEAFSPFIPLNIDDSSLPATILRWKLTNRSDAPVAGALTGFLENGVARSANRDLMVSRVSAIGREADALLLNFSASVSFAKELELPDQGTMSLALLSAGPSDTGLKNLADRPEHRPAGSLTRKFSLAPGESHEAVFIVAWCFPNLSLAWSMDPMQEGIKVKNKGGRHYATRFDSAAAVARYVAREYERLYSQTRLWHECWYESSTLPHWFLERTLLNASTLATSTSFRFADGRFYGTEGVGGGPGTCTHVWYYEQALGRLFPVLDVILRERTDFDPEIGFKPDGMVDNRGEYGWGPATDGQAGVILRSLRDHQTSIDNAFLKRNWASIKKAMQWLIDQDGNADGILEGAQPNTLDAAWYGPVAWTGSLYLAALRASEEMALDVGDSGFAKTCREIFERGRKNFVERLFSEDYFINIPDPKHPEAINSGTGCEIDQVLGQSWAFQVGLGRILPEKETRSALASIWRYSFVPDVGPLRSASRPGRWLAMPGEAGVLICSFPRADWDIKKAGGKGDFDFAAGYFNECMNGFEHQVAGHMLWEGMILEGLAVERAVHDRYSAVYRNPWNEVEAGDHYARAMASYGVFIAACGFEYHGPKGYMAFAPRLTPEDFKCAFTAAQGWGTFTQKVRNGTLTATIDLKWGSLLLRSLSLTPLSTPVSAHAIVTVNGKRVAARTALLNARAHISLSQDAHVKAGDQVAVSLS